MDVALLVLQLMELQTLDLTTLDDIELLALLTLSEHELALLQVDGLQPIYQLKLLESIKLIEQLDLLQEVDFERPLLDIRVDDNLLKDLAIKSIH